MGTRTLSSMSKSNLSKKASARCTIGAFGAILFFNVSYMFNQMEQASVLAIVASVIIYTVLISNVTCRAKMWSAATIASGLIYKDDLKLFRVGLTSILYGYMLLWLGMIPLV